MLPKIVKLVRKTNVLRIYDGNPEYSAIFDVTHIRRRGKGWYDIFDGKKLLGFISNIAEVKEEWLNGWKNSYSFTSQK